MRLFRNSRTFYNLYPQVAGLFSISATASHKLIGKIHPTSSDEFTTPAKMIIERLSFSHLCEIMTQDNPQARFFYETECIKGTRSVKKLYYPRKS